jgi:hypothetical protein
VRSARDAISTGRELTPMEAVWESMAEQFLDTETRHLLPHTAALCLRAGLTEAAAFDVWRFQIVPLVGSNLFSVAGEWVGWDRRWLFARAARERPGWVKAFDYRCMKPLVHGEWLAIAGCMRLLPRTGEARLEWLARAFFDTLPPPDPPPGSTRPELLALFEYEVAALLAHVADERELADGSARIRAALRWPGP